MNHSISVEHLTETASGGVACLQLLEIIPTSVLKNFVIIINIFYFSELVRVL